MDTENFAFNDSSDSEIIENFCAVLPGVGITILSNGLIVETVHGGDLTSLVVASQKSDVCWVLHLEAQQELEGFNRVESSVDKVTHENVARRWDLATLVEQLEQIVELAMNITADSHWSFDRLNVAFFDEDLLDFLAKDAELTLRQDSALLDSLKPAIDVTLAHF